MSTIEVGPAENLYQVLVKVSDSSETEINLVFAEKASLLGNITNLKILQKEAEKLGKKLTFQAPTEAGQNLIAALSEPEAVAISCPVEVPPSTQAPPAWVEKFRLKFWDLITFRKGWFRPHWRWWGLALGVLLLLLGGAAWAFWRVPKATVRLKVKSQELVKSLEVTASPSAKVADAEQRVIPAVLVKVLEKGEKKGETTGIEVVGEPAHGQVTIYNRTNSERGLGAGTELIYSTVEGDTIKALKFKLEEAVTVPAQTSIVSAEQRVYISGKAEDVPVTALEIGGDYNLPAETSFTVDQLSTEDFLAKSSQSFTGGESHEAKVVSQEDQDSLQAKLWEELKERAFSDLQAKLVGDQKLETGSVTYQVQTTEFDYEVGDQAEELGLKLTLEAQALVYSYKDLVDLVSNLLTNFVPEQYLLSEQDKNVEVAVSQTDEGGSFLKFQAKIKGYVLPRLDQEKIREVLVGKRLRQAQEYLASLPSVESVGVSVWPPLPSFLLRLPRTGSRIDLIIEKD